METIKIILESHLVNTDYIRDVRHAKLLRRERDIPIGTPVGEFFRINFLGCDPTDYLIRVNNQPIPASYILSKGDVVTVVPNNLENELIMTSTVCTSGVIYFGPVSDEEVDPALLELEAKTNKLMEKK